MGSAEQVWLLVRLLQRVVAARGGDPEAVLVEYGLGGAVPPTPPPSKMSALSPLLTGPHGEQ